MNHYRCSDGERISKAEIDRKVRQAKESIIQAQKNDYGFNFCKECYENGVPKISDQMELMILDCAHVKSVNDCQREGKSELAWDKANIRILCRHHHREWDKTNVKFKQ